MTYRGSEDFAREVGPLQRLVRGMARKFAITLTDGVLWQVLGQRGGQGGPETKNVEPFTGIGFYSRPSSSGKPEAVSVAIGGAKNLVIVATRDEATRKTGAGDLAADETCVFNSTARVITKANGTVEIRLHSGAALVQPTMRGTTYRTAEDIMLTAVAAAFTACATAWTGLGISAAATACTAAATAITAFQAAAATYLTTVAKVQ